MSSSSGDGDEGKAIIRVLGAYIEILSNVGSAATYLLFLAAAITGTLIITIMTAIFPIVTFGVGIGLACLTALMVLAGYASATIWRVSGEFATSKTQSEAENEEWRKKSKKKAGIMISAGWAVIFIAVWLLSSYLVKWPYTVPVSVSLGVGLGNLVTYPYRRMMGSTDFQPLAVGSYLIVTTPLYFFLPTNASLSLEVLGFVLLMINLSVSYFGTAIAYSISAKKRAEGVLHAARTSPSTQSKQQ